MLIQILILKRTVSSAGWDTDQFLTDPTAAALIGLTIIKNVRYLTLSQTEIVDHFSAT
jgi:hypothetical protein